ncbi:amino acid ABC transporter ATP-binding protein [Stigmatella sp. ncwal1]|uniref:Amino acid ABC transporter ATP-binding protein n=1 Tax=Stigmatella ashevillensis TaxID=2995309 RepID=A0ABT5DJ37_9BACT|nr:amino acid ABC transporter ATP-binding protein [Stigmatella ashevillena]MDC0713667.1 amino acid ABC transporter ATP-binding protein [Stigmatella ashevillena]
MSEPIIRVEGLRKSFGPREVLRGIDLEVARGEVVVLIGPSGCGKSTLLRCLNYLEVPTQGRVWLRGELLGRQEKDGRLVARPEAEVDLQRTRVGMVFQRFNLFPHMTALGNVIEAPMRVKGMPRARAEALGLRLLERVELLDRKDEYPVRLSGGQQQRVAIARAMAMEPEVMLFDEATSALDPELADEVLQVMQGLAQEGMTMLVVTHEMGFAREVAHRIIVLEEGRILEQGPPSVVFTQPSQPRTREFLRKVLHAPSQGP